MFYFSLKQSVQREIRPSWKRRKVFLYLLQIGLKASNCPSNFPIRTFNLFPASSKKEETNKHSSSWFFSSWLSFCSWLSCWDFFTKSILVLRFLLWLSFYPLISLTLQAFKQFSLQNSLSVFTPSYLHSEKAE